MIEKIIFKKGTGHKLDYISNLPCIEKMGREITFKKGLNIIIGPNGSGKTSILKAVGDYLAASQYGESCLSKCFLMNYAYRNPAKNEKTFNFPFDIIHDGQAILFCDPKRSTGIDMGKVDDDFALGGILELIAMKKESSGERVSRRVIPFLDVMMGKKPKPRGLGAAFNLSELNDVYESLVETFVKENFKGSIPKGQMTILMDEPESSLGMINQILFWEKIIKNESILKEFQVILVSHSYQALNIKGAHYIETKKGYLKACKDLICGKISVDEAKSFATNLIQKLTKKEIKLIKLIDKSFVDDTNGCLFGRENEELKKLITIGFICSHTLKKQKKESQTSIRQTKPRDHFRKKYIYIVTEKGKQYLTMHS